MRKVTELTHQDFPNINPSQFEEWKSSIIKHSKASKPMPFLAVGFLFLQLIIGGALIGIFLWSIFLVYLFAYLGTLAYKSKKLFKQMGITQEDIKKACSK